MSLANGEDCLFNTAVANVDCMSVFCNVPLVLGMPIRRILCVLFTVQIAEDWVKSEPAVFLLIHLPSDGCAS